MKWVNTACRVRYIIFRIEDFSIIFYAVAKGGSNFFIGLLCNVETRKGGIHRMWVSATDRLVRK